MGRKALVFTTVLLLLLVIATAVWIERVLPPVHMVWRYGSSYIPEPTGRVLTASGVEFVEIGPGCYRMGSDQGAEGGDFLGLWCARFGLPWGDQPKPSNEMPVHWVEFPRGFLIAKTEVTNAQYEAFDPNHERSEDSPGDDDPVVDVSWEDAKGYCAWLSEKSGQAIRLPSESEWECACRAGSNREFCFGDDDKLLGRYGWYDVNSDGKAHGVGTGRANAWGLHDFHGNVWELCEDTYHDSYEGAPADGTAWSEGGEGWDPGSPYRIIRGGSWEDPAVYCRSALRDWIDPGRWFGDLGFRPAYWPSEN